MTSDFTVLLVCTGNICRSPFAEQWLRRRFGSGSPPTFASAGTRGVDGQPLPEFSARLIAEHVGTPDRHEARLLTRDDVAAADLVLALAREHRSATVRLLPRASQKTFALREFARLSVDGGPVTIGRPSSDPRATLTEAVGLVAARRGAVRPPLDPADDDVLDPFGLDYEAYEASAASMIPALEAVATFLDEAIGLNTGRR